MKAHPKSATDSKEGTKHDPAQACLICTSDPTPKKHANLNHNALDTLVAPQTLDCNQVQHKTHGSLWADEEAAEPAALEDTGNGKGAKTSAQTGVKSNAGNGGVKGGNSTASFAVNGDIEGGGAKGGYGKGPPASLGTARGKGGRLKGGGAVPLAHLHGGDNALSCIIDHGEAQLGVGVKASRA